jgi:hypothetical protein
MWGDRQRITAEATTTQVLEGDDKHWKLVTVHENRHSGLAPACCVRFLRSPVYHVIIIFVTLINALVRNYIYLSFYFFHFQYSLTNREILESLSEL